MLLLWQTHNDGSPTPVAANLKSIEWLTHGLWVTEVLKKRFLYLLAEIIKNKASSVSLPTVGTPVNCATRPYGRYTSRAISATPYILGREQPTRPEAL
jgi:hypothetical protein